MLKVPQLEEGTQRPEVEKEEALEETIIGIEL